MILGFGPIHLCEVKTEEQAFAEMCRYLEVNGLHSDSTEVRMSDFGYKEVAFGNLWETHRGRYPDSVGRFRIYYDNRTLNDYDKCKDVDSFVRNYKHAFRAGFESLDFRFWWADIADAHFGTEENDKFVDSIAQYVGNYIQDMHEREKSGRFPLTFDT